MVEVLGDAVEVAAEELQRGVRAEPSKTGASSHCAGTAQAGVGALVGGRRACEPVGEDLVDHGVAAPLGRRVVAETREVEGVGDVVVDDPGLVQPALVPPGPATRKR